MGITHTPSTEAGSVPSGYQSFYVLGESTKIIKNAVDVACNFNPATAQPYSVFSLVSYQNRSRIYIDLRGNGYSFNKMDFTGADAVFELDKGGVLTMDNWAPPYYTIIPPGRGSLLMGNLTGPGNTITGVDGGDYIFVAGGPINVFRGATDKQPGTGDGNFVADMWELQHLESGGPNAQKKYIIPVGENTAGTPDFLGAGELVGGTFAVVQSTADGTLVHYSRQGVPLTKALSRGESFVIQHVWEGDYIESNNKVQVGLIASGGKTYDIRYFTLKDVGFTGRDFYVPTFPSGYSPMNLRFHIYAVTGAHVTIETDAGIAPGWNNKVIAVNTTDTGFTTAGTTPVHIYAKPGERIAVLVSVDTGSGDRDWGFTPVDTGSLVNEYFIPYAPSGKNAAEDMQLWVTPVYSGTTIYADYNQDDAVDDSTTLNKLEAYGFYDSDMDNTGTRLFADFPFSVVYGESIYALVGGDFSGYDWGYTILPLHYASANVTLDIFKKVYPPTVSTCANVSFTLTVKTGLMDDLLMMNVNVTDTLPPGFLYILGSSNVTHTDASVTHEDPAVNGQLLTWTLNENMLPNQTITVHFKAQPSPIPKENYINEGAAWGIDPFNNTYNPKDTAFITVAAGGVVEGWIWNVTKAPKVGVPDISVYLVNATDGSIINATSTNGNGFYDFPGLLDGNYSVFYDHTDPELYGLAPKSDDDPTEPPWSPLTSSANFTLGTDCTHIHSFMVALPVDLNITKTGPDRAQIGETVTYTIEVGNLGLTDAANVTIHDSLCGPPIYMGGDTDMDDEVDPGELWTYTCNYTVKATDTSPLVNIVTVNTTDPETDYTNNNATWSVRIIVTNMTVIKSLLEPPGGEAFVGETVTFRVNVTNRGNQPLEYVPLNDTYNPVKLDYVSASPSPDIVSEATGTLLWFDVTGGAGLAPGSWIAVNITYVAAESTAPNVTVNLARVIEAKVLDEEIYLDGNDTEQVMILAFGMLVDKSVKTPPSGIANIGDNVVFEVKVTNTGDIPILVIPLKDTYDPAKLDYIEATPAPDAVDEASGVLDWNDLTGPGSLAPSTTVTVQVKFKALEATTGSGTTDLAEVIDAYLGDDTYLNGSDTASVVILSPIGGEVMRNPLSQAAPILS
ncbi:MAG: hypothetical protein ABIJ47_05280, partial [Candidatus Bathyarchaeota archaeon]